MNCPKCGGEQLFVINSRHRDCESIRRTRLCSLCSYKFNTLEYEEEQVNQTGRGDIK